ncbi:hypothetical protein BJY52DRAFT_1225882 [Lactarius psammicola]|nr:hypothetical protein BJY52DRAFT_1225882 [Lactarius psammicola]
MGNSRAEELEVRQASGWYSSGGGDWGGPLSLLCPRLRERREGAETKGGRRGGRKEGGHVNGATCTKGGGLSKWGCHGNGGGGAPFSPPVCVERMGRGDARWEDVNEGDGELSATVIASVPANSRDWGPSMPSTPTSKPHKGVKMPSHCHTAAMALHNNDRSRPWYLSYRRPLLSQWPPQLYRHVTTTHWRAPATHVQEKKTGPCEPPMPTMKTVTQLWG